MSTAPHAPAITQPDDFAGRVAIVTGAAAGIGLATSQLLARCGAQLVLVDRSQAVLELAERLAGGSQHHLGCVLDVCDEAAIGRCIAQIEARYGRIDILVNNAGVALLQEAEVASSSDWDRTMAINLKAPFLLAQAVLPMMRRQQCGRIINLASQASVVALERHAAYCASKAGLVALSRVLALEWACHGITVNAISPTVVETELGKQAWAGPVGVAMRARIPVGRFAQPEEVAHLVAYLASPQAAMITGENILIDGGYTVA
ncbi:2-deoxy-D-gluconate 3-dehydrogenase [Herbaspirillum rubrisubalbicans]|uniref:GolD/DthD family dehydrogenase n=1 Tax=Herbaspirillum rubrisubalbicans TaxID=80842 RepID=UPI00209E4C7F|nr:D-threitol dehydrogenase [Herbaspirillum rubrisubalbicans]MCP1576377.1 2-deoxy-D-gluconate 3-dehydrogenase [Herbaspirillum rubrisubalbicans]